MVNIGGGLQDKAANGRRRRAVGPKAIQQRACVPLNMLLLLCAQCKSAPLTHVCTARSLPHGRVVRMRLLEACCFRKKLGQF